MSNDDEVTLNEPVDDGALLRALMPGVTIRWDPSGVFQVELPDSDEAS